MRLKVNVFRQNESMSVNVPNDISPDKIGTHIILISPQKHVVCTH